MDQCECRKNASYLLEYVEEGSECDSEFLPTGRKDRRDTMQVVMSLDK